jgi:DNA polymerase III alpha subunit
MGLVKIDLLGNRALTILEDARREIFRLGGDPEEDGGLGLPGSGFHAELPPRDSLVEPLLTKGSTIGVSQIESPGMRSLLIRMEARSLDEVIQAIALIRPGPAGSGMLDRYVRRARGEEPTPALPPDLAGILAESKGVLLYQEDVIQVLAAFCGTDLVEGDLLRRRIEEGDPNARQEFFEAAAKREVPRSLAQGFWVQVRRFAGFSFNKAHAVTYGRLSWRLLRLKARYPAALFSALLASETGYYAPAVYIEEAKRCGITILPPCVNRSAASFTISPGTTSPNGSTAGACAWSMGVPPWGRGAIRVGLGQVRGMPEAFVQRILEERAEGGPFFSVGGFVERVARRKRGLGVSAQELAVQEAWVEALILVGAFDLCEGTRGEKLWRFRLEFQDRLRAAAAADEPALFPEALAPRTPILPSLPPFTKERRREIEARLLGFFCGSEALEGLVRGLTPLSDLHPEIGEHIRVLGHVAALRGHRTRNGKHMCFVTLEDATGMLEAVLFPDVWQRFGGTLAEASVVFLEGRLESREGALVLEVDRVEKV